MNKKKKESSSVWTVGYKVKNDIVLILALLLLVSAAALGSLLFRSEGDTVVVTVDGHAFGEYSLNEDRTVEIKNGDGYNLLVIEGGEARVESASCPDGICAAHRPVRHNGQSIICLPNKVVVEIRTANKSQPDIIA